ncbi:MAG TPA: 16S rRNA (uracil(1498)-N(3))-methyltransferase [Xanthomonadales bacterium]|nr:16S rRNA (uracil(1498)-N(3))-methyltransferase [Xanthomonadales bacterium]
MRRIRVFVDDAIAAGEPLALNAFASDHLLKVLRLSRGASVTVFNGDGIDYEGTLEVIGKGSAAVLVASAQPVANESPLELVLAQSVARGEKMDLILQKATELGVVRIVPLVSERTEVRLDEDRAGRRLAHWQRVVQSACEQCGRAVVPEIDAPIALPAWVAEMRDADAARLALHPDGARTLRELAPGAAQPIVLAVGPEGGFGERDLDALAQGGFERLALGPRILRTETAGLAAIAALQAMFGDLA